MKPKLCTDLEQSKKLKEILPIESADMVLLHEEPYETSDSKFDGLHQALCVAFSQYDKSWRQKYRNISYFPCWSLAALLNTLPVSCDDGQHCLALINSNPNGEIEWLCCYEDCKGNLLYECYASSQVDACVEMIIKLKDKKLL